MGLEDCPRFTISLCEGPTCPARRQIEDGEKAVNSHNILLELRKRLDEIIEANIRTKALWADLGALIELEGVQSQRMTTALLKIQMMPCSRACMTGQPLPKTMVSFENFDLELEEPQVVRVMDCVNAKDAATRIIAVVRAMVLDVSGRL
ncbi:MAG TPA: hypothetical protein VIT68_03365 [Candidatus Gracilibacteria bacterium]